MALVTSAVAPIPEDLPAVAVQQPSLYRLEVGLMVFYGWLLLVTPAFSGLIRGRLPIEISTRGAKFAEDADQSAALNDIALQELRSEVGHISDELTKAEEEINSLKKRGDIT